MADWMKDVEPHVYQGRIKVPYTWWAGEWGSRFFTELRDNKKIMGTKCPTCSQVFVPPKKNCGQCFSLCDEWVEVGPRGTLVSYTVVNYTESIHPVPAPFANGIIRLEGTENGIPHLIGGIELEQMQTGCQVEPVFKDERKGSILDIQHFQPI